METFNRIPLTCFLCGCHLIGGIDTFGDIGQECCQSCFWELHGQEGTVWYGMAPHKHDLSFTGSYVGSAVFDILLGPPTLEGSFWIEFHKAWFTPDDENPEQGIWHTD